MNFFGDLQQSELEQFFPEEEVKRAYTEDENYRAYKMFSMMDVDNGGAISLREIKRVLMGESVRYVSAEFDHPDSGIVFGLDEEKCVIIVDIEMDSAATKYPYLMQRMRLYRINNFVVKKHNEKALNEVFQELLRLHDEPVRLEFYEPEIIINKFTCFLDIEVDGEVFSVVLPIGAVYNHVLFCDRIRQLLCDTSMMLDHIEVDFIPEKRQILFRSYEEPFRLLFGTGPNFRRSCRYTLGFEGEDYPYAYEHAGQPMLMDLQLGVTQAQADILMNELFLKYDRDNSGEFEFEEFRDFYIRYLDSEDSLDRLRKYALYRFRDIEKEKFVLKQRQDRKNKLKRREYLREKNAEITKAQRARFMADSFVDAYGNRRRIYRHRTVNRLTSEGDKQITLLKEEKELAEDAFEDLMKVTRTTLASAMSLGGAGGDASVTSAATATKGAAEGNDEDSVPPTGFHATVLNRHEVRMRARMMQKQKQQQQAIRRKDVLRRMVQANQALQLQQRQNARLHQEDAVDMQTMDLHYRIKRELSQSVDVSANELYENIQSYGVDVSRLITTPAVKITSAILGDRLDRDSIDVTSMSSSVVHPASQYYYHVKENQRSSKATFDAERLNPTFFTADYVRQPSRHSNHAFGMAKIMYRMRQEGVRYRITHGMEASLNHTYPPDEDLAAFLEEKRKWEEANDPQRLLKTSTNQRKKVSFKEIEPVGQRGLVARLTIVSIKLDQLASVHALAKNSPFVNVYIGSYKFVTEAYSYAGSTCEWDDLNWVVRLYAKDTLQLDVFSGSATNYAYVGSHRVTSAQIMELRYEVDNVIVISGKLYNQQVAALQQKASKRSKKSGSRGMTAEEDTHPQAMGVFHLRANLEKGKDWDWFIQNYEKNQARAERLAKEKQRLSHTYTGPKEWLNIRTYFPLEVQIVDVVLYDVHSSLASWIYTSRITLTLDAGRSEYTTDEQYAVINRQDSAEWNKLQWEFTIESPEVHLIYKIYAHGKYIGRYVLSAATLAEKLTVTTHELEFTGELVVNLGAGDAKIVGKVMTKMLVNPLSGQEITRYRELHPTTPTIDDHLRPDYLVALPAVFVFEKAELSATNLHSITFQGTFILRLHYEHYRFETRIEVPSRTKRVLIPSLDWQIPLHDRRKVTILLEHVSKGPLPEPPAIVHFQTDEFCALEKNAESGVLLRKFVFVDNEIKAKVAFYATVSLERDYVAIDRLLHDIDPTHNLRVVDPVYTKDGLVMVEGNQEFWEMQGKYYRSNDGVDGAGNGSGTARSSRYEPPPVGEEETKRGGNGMLTLDDLRGSTTSLVGSQVDDGGGSRSVRTGALVMSSNISLPVTLQVTELLVTDLYGVHYLVKNSPRVHVVVGSQAECTTVSNRSGAHAFWSGLDMKFTIQNYDTSIRISVDSQETVIGECVIAIPTLFSCRPNKTGMREILSTLTLTMKTPSSSQQQAQHQIRGKVKCLYFIDQANKLGIPTSDVQLGALKYISYPIQLVILQIAVTNLRAVHLFGRNSPWVKMMELDPTHTKFFSTPMLKQAGGFGRWKQLMWSAVLRDELTTFHFQVMSESMVIGATLVSADALLHMVPTKEGTCEMVLPLTSIENHLRGGELQLTYSYEPYVEEDEEDEDEDAADGDAAAVAVVKGASSPSAAAAAAAAAGARNDGGLSAPSTASTTSSFFSLRGGPHRPQLSSPFSTSSALSFRTNPRPPATVNTALPISSDAVVKDHRLVMLCTMVIVLRKPKARKVAAAKNHRAANPEEYPIWNLSTTRAQIVCGKYIHAVRLKCQHLPSNTASSQPRPIWAESGGDDASTSAASLWSEDTRNHRNNSSIILRSAPLIEKFVVSASKPVYIRLFDGNDLTIGDSVYSFKDMVETSPLTSSGFHVCDRDLWKDGELVGLVRMQVRVTEDIPPIIRATLIDGNLQLQSSHNQHSSIDVHHPSVWTAERRLMYPLGVRFSHVSMVDIDVEKLIPSALLQVPVEPDENEGGDGEGKTPAGANDGGDSPSPTQTMTRPVAEIKVKQVEIFCRIRFAGELRSSMTTFALSSDMYESGLVWEFADTAYSIAHDQEVWILEIAALGKILGICKIPAFDLRYARELHIRQTSDEQQSNSGITSVTDLLQTLPDSTLYFNVWNAQKEVTGRIMVQFNLHELFLSGDEDDRQRSLQMIAATPRSAPAVSAVAAPGAITAGGPLASASPIGFIRFISLRAHELRQLYPLFPNSPRVRITIGERVYETKEIPESGGEGVWERIAWGRINLRPSITKLAFTVLSHNEVIGTWEMTMEEFITSIRRAKEFAESGASPSMTNEPPVTVDGSGAVTVQLTGVLWKNRRMMGNLTMRFVGRLTDDDNDDRAKKGITNESTERRGLLRTASAFFSRRASSPNLKQPLTDNSASLVIGERSSTIHPPTAAAATAEESNHPLPAPETALAPSSSIVSSSQSMDGIPLGTMPQQATTPAGGIRQAMQAVLDAADVAHHPQLANNSFASSYNGGQPPVGAVAPQNTLAASLSSSLVDDHPAAVAALPETIDFQFVALSVSHIRRNPNEEAVAFTFKNPPKLFVTCGGWAAETIKLSTVSENAVTTQFKWLVSRYPAWHFRTEGTPFMKVSLQTSDTKRLLGTVFISMTDLLQTPTDHIGLMHMGRTLMSPNDEPVAHLELVYRVIVRIQEDTPPPWWLNTAMDPNRLNQSWSMLSASLAEHMPHHPDRAAAFVRDLSNPRVDEDSKTLFSSTSTLSINTLHHLMPGDALATVDADVMAGSNEFQLVTPVVHPPFVLWITRAALTQIQTPGWMLESDAMRNMIVIRAVTHYTGYATSTIATAANEVFWEELEGHVDDDGQATLSLPPPPSAAASTAGGGGGGSSAMMSPTTARTGPSEGGQTAETGADGGDGDGMFENIAKDRAWQFRFFDLQETFKIEVFNLAKPFGTCGLTAQDLLKLPRTMQGEVEIHLPVTLGRKDVAQLHFTGYILPLPRPEEQTEEKTVASVASELQAIERNEHLAYIMRLKYISCEDISVMAHEIRVKMVSEHEGTQVSPLLKNLYGRVQYAPTSWSDVKFFQRSLVTLSVIDQRGEVLGATTMDVYDIQRAPIDQRPLTALTNDGNANDDTAAARPGTGGTQHSPAKDEAVANWVDTGSQSPRSQRRRRRKQRWQNIAVVYLDLILGPAKRGRIALAFERLSPSQYHAAIADDNLLSARSDITEDEPVIRQLTNDWGITISQIRLSHLKPVHQFGKNSPMVTLEVSGRKFQSDCRAFAGKKATFEDLSWMIDCREKLALKFKVTSASVTVGTCSILIDELYEHTLDKHYEMEVERTLVKDKKEMGSISIRLQGHPPLPPLSTNTGYIDSAGSIVTIRTQGENQTMHFRPVDLVSNVDYQALLVDNMEGYRVLQEMDVQTVRLTIASSNRAASSGSPWDHSEPYDDSRYDDASTIRTYEDDYTTASQSRRDELDDAMQSLADEIDDVSHPSFHSGGMALLSKQHSEVSFQLPSTMGDEEMHSPSATALSRKPSIRSGTHSPVPVPPRKQSRDEVSHASKVHFSEGHSLPMGSSPELKKQRSTNSLPPPLRPGSVPTVPSAAEPLPGSIDRNQPSQMLTSRSWDGGISNQPTSTVTEAGRPRTSRGPEAPRFVPKLLPAAAVVEETNGQMLSSASLPSLPSQSQSRRQSTVDPRRQSVLSKAGSRRYSLGSALEGTISLPEESSADDHQVDGEADGDGDGEGAGEHESKSGSALQRSVSFSNSQQRRGSDDITSATSASSMPESTVEEDDNDASSVGTSTIVYARPYGITDPDGDDSLYSNRSSLQLEDDLGNNEDDTRSNADTLSMPTSARSEASSASSFYSQTTSRSSTATSTAASSRASSHATTPREPQETSIAIVDAEDQSPETFTPPAGLDAGGMVPGPMQKQPSQSSLRSILKPSSRTVPDDVGSGTGTATTGAEDEATEEDDEDDDESDESTESSSENKTAEDTTEDVSGATEDNDGTEDGEDGEGDDASSTTSGASSATSMSSKSSTTSSSPGREGEPSPATAITRLTRSEMEEIARQQPIPSLRLLFLRDEQPIPKNQMALLLATDLTRAIIVQVVSSLVAMSEGTSFMGARRHVARTLQLDVEKLPLAQRRTLISVDFIRQVVFAAGTQAYQKVVIDRRVADIEATQPPLPQTVENPETEQPIAVKDKAKSSKSKAKSKKSAASAKKVPTSGSDAVPSADAAATAAGANGTVPVATTAPPSSPPLSPTTRSSRKTLVKRMSVEISPKANMKKRQAVTMTSGITNPMIEKRQQAQEWSDKLEKEMERKLMLSKPMRARVRILDLLGLDVGSIDAQVRPSRPYLTACKPFGNWAAETPVVKLEMVKPLPPALEAKRDAARAEGKTDDEVSLPSIWQETAAFDAGIHPAAAPMAYTLNFTELFGKYRWEEFVLRLGQELLLEIRDAGSNLIVAKSVLPYTQLLSKLPGDQEIFESPLFVVFTVANEFGGGTMSGILRVRLDLSVNVFVRTKKSASYWEQYRAQHWMVYPLTPINFGAVRQKFREIAEDYDKQRLIHPSYFGFKVRIRGNEEDESRFLHPVFSGYNLARKLAIAKSASKDAKVQAMKTRAANPFRYDPSLKDLGKCPICGDGLPGCPRCFMMPTRDFDGSFYAPREFAFDPAEERKKAMQREQRIVALKAKRRRRLSSLQFSSIAELNLESLGLSQLLSHEKIMTTGMSMADISKEITKMYEQEMHTEVTQEEQREQALLRKLHTRMTTFNSVRAARLFLQRVLNIYVKIMPTGHTIRLTMLTNDPVHLLYDRFNWHFPTQKNHHPMILLPTSNGFFELHPEIAWENEMEIADNRGYDPLGAFFQIQDQTCSSFVVLYYANYIREAVAPMVQSFFAANTTFALKRLPTYTGMDRAPKDLVKDEVQQWFTKVISVEYRLQQEEARAFYHQLGRAYHASAVAAKQKEQVRSKQAKEFSAQQKKLIQQRFASQLKRLGTAGGKTASRDVKTRQRMLEQLESRERNKRKTQLFVDEKDNLLQTVKDDDTVAQTFGVSTKKPRGGRGGGGEGDEDDDDLESVLSLSAVQLDDLPMDSEMFPEDYESGSSYYSDDYTRSDSGSGSEYYSGSESYDTGSYADDAMSTSDRSQSTAYTDAVSATASNPVKSTKVPPLPVNEDGRIFPAAASAAAVLQHHRQDQAYVAQTLAQLRRDSKGGDGHPMPGSATKGRLSTIPSLSLHDDTLSISQQTEPSELSYSARSMTSYLTESDYYGGSQYTGSDYTGSDYSGSEYTGSEYGSENDFRSLSDAESSIASRSQYSYSPMNSARTTSTTDSQTPRSQRTLDTAVTPYSVISQQSLQPYPSEVADEDSLPPANLIGAASANRQVSRTQLSRTQQDAQRRLQQTLRDETVQLQDQLLGDRLPSTLEQQERPRRRRSGDNAGDDVLLDIAPEANGGLVPVQDVDDALSLFSGHRRHQYPSAHEQRALDRLMLAKKKKIHRVLRPHEDAYGVGRDGALTGGGNVDDQASLYSHRRLDDDQSSTGDGVDHDQSVDASQTDASSLYSMATSVTSRSTASDPDDVSSLATSQSGLFTFRDDVSLPSKAMYGDMDEEINVISIQPMPEDESTSGRLRHRRTGSKKPKTVSGTVSEHFETNFLQGGRDGDEESSVDGGLSLYSHPSVGASSTSASSASYSMTSESQSQSQSQSQSPSRTQSSTTSHPAALGSGRQPNAAMHSKNHRNSHRHQQHHPAFAGPAFPSLPDDDGDDDDGDEVMSQVTFQTQTSQRSLLSHGDGEDEDEEDTRSFAQASQSTASSQSPSVFSQYTPYYSTSSATQLSSTASMGTAQSSVYSGAGSTASASSQGSSTVSASGTSTAASSATYSTGGSTNEDETTRNTRYNRRYQGYGYMNPPTDGSESGATSFTNGEGDSTALSSARSASSTYSSFSSQSLDSRSSYDSYVTASSAHSSDASSYASRSYVTASEGTERSTQMDSSVTSSMWSRGSETGSRVASSSLLGPLTETPSTTTRTLGSTSVSYDTRRSMTKSTKSSRYSGYGYLEADESTIESSTLDPTRSSHTQGDSDDSHLDQDADDGEEDDVDDGSSVLSESSYASSLSSSSSFVRRKKAVREIAQAMSEIGDTDMEPIAALPMVLHPPKSPPKESASKTLPFAFTTL